MIRKGLLIVVSGPSGVGKSTLCKKTISQVEGTTLSISYTTRTPRPGEQEGVDYFFADEAQFQEMVQREEFAEWAMVYGHRYGTPLSKLREALEGGNDVLLDIDAQGARQIMKRFADAVFVFVVPPSLESLRTRLVERKGDTPEEIQRRFQRASEEIKNYGSYDYIIRNDDLHRALRELEAVVVAERMRTTRINATWLRERGLLLEEGHGTQHSPNVGTV